MKVPEAKHLELWRDRFERNRWGSKMRQPLYSDWRSARSGLVNDLQRKLKNAWLEG